MPRPPMLPTIDWAALLAAGIDFDTWIANAQMKNHAETMRAEADALTLEPGMTAHLGALGRAVNVVAIAEDWCGDVVRHAPVLERLRRAAPRVTVKYIRRDQSLETFARFLTNGGEAIPKFVFLSEDLVEVGSWGPMPASCRELIARGKACGDVGTARERVTKRYEADPGRREVIAELAALIDIAACEGV